MVDSILERFRLSRRVHRCPKTPCRIIQISLTPEQDQPVNPDVLALLVALDRLLSVGSYYTPTHDRYQQVAREAEQAVRKVLGPSPELGIEISNDGFYILDQEIAADTREGRRLFELFNPLNIALIELQADVSAQDLHDALTVFKKLKTS